MRCANAHWIATRPSTDPRAKDSPVPGKHEITLDCHFSGESMVWRKPLSISPVSWTHLPDSCWLVEIDQLDLSVSGCDGLPSTRSPAQAQQPSRLTSNLPAVSMLYALSTKAISATGFGDLKSQYCASITAPARTRGTHSELLVPSSGRDHPSICIQPPNAFDRRVVCCYLLRLTRCDIVHLDRVVTSCRE